MMMVYSAGYVLLDLEDSTTFVVSFDISNFVVTRPRLTYRVLIIEWTKEKPYLNNIPNYHFTTAFYVFFVEDTFPWLPRCNVILRDEWE